MRKSVTKIIKATAAFAMAIGAGVGAGISDQKARPVFADDSGLTASDGTFIIDFYDSGKLSSTSGTGLTNNNYSNFVKVAGGLTKTNVVTSVSVTGTVQYGKNGGLTAGTGTAAGANSHYVTFNIGNNYAVNKCTVYATAYESGRWKLNGNVANSGSLGSKGVEFSSVTSPLVWNNLNGITSLTFKKDNGSDGDQKRLTIYTIVCEYGTGGEEPPEPTTYTGVTVSEKTALTGTYKGEAYYECRASVTGTGSYSSVVTWSITASNTYGTNASIANIATIDTNGKITFLDNVNALYVWATAADESTHNTTVFSVAASGLLDNTIPSWTKVTDKNDISVNKVYALSNDGSNYAEAAVVSSQIALTTKLSRVGYIVLKSTSGGYHARFATYENDAWVVDTGKYINWTSSTSLSGGATASTVWTLVENGVNGVYLKISDGRHIGLGNNVIKAYADVESNAPVYLWEVDSLPAINCDSIELTGKPADSMSIGDTATLGYYALGTDGNKWTGDVVYSISNESTSGVVELSATSGESVTLTAKKVGTARVSVRDKDEKADADYYDVTVLPDPERTELPVGNYEVEINYSSVKKDDEVPASASYEIKDKEGTGAGRVWYKNMTIAYSNVTASYATEYTFSKNGNASSATITTTSEVAKVTEVVISYWDSNRLTLTDAGSNEIAIASSEGNVCTYNLNSASFTLSSTNTTTSIFSIRITFSVVNENEEFLSLVINKGETTSSFTEGDAPNATGLTVHENYSTDGSAISRYEDVTASVTWNYSIGTIGEKTTSYTVTATYGGHTSAPVTIDGFTVTPIAKYSLFESSIAEGDYIIYYGGAAINNTILENRAQYEEVSPVNDKILTNDASIIWHIAPADENYFTIYNADADGYLASTGAKNKAQLLDDGTDDKALWTIQVNNGKFEFVNKQNTANGVNANLRKNDTYGFACYADSTGGKLSLYRATVDTYLKSASTVATYTEEASGNILRLGSSISVEKWNSLVAIGEITDYGVMIYKTDSEAKITSKTPVEDAYRNSGVEPAIARKGNGNHPAATDGNYVFTARIKVSNADTIFCAASFVVIGGQYYFFNEQHVTARGLGA